MPGTENLEPIVDALAEGLNVTHKVISGGGILAALGMSDELYALRLMDPSKVKEQFADLDPLERRKLNERFKGKLVLSDKSLEQRIEGGADVLEEAADIVIDAVGLIAKAQGVFGKVQKLFSPAASTAPVV